MPVFSSKYPGQTVQQLNATQTEVVGRLGRVVHLTDEDYTVDPQDDLIILEATTSTGDWTVAFPDSLPDNNRVTLVMPAAPGGTDAYVTSGLAAEATFNAAGQAATVLTAEGVSVVQGSAAPTTPTSSVLIGDGTGSTTVRQNKSNAGTAAYQLAVGATLRGDLALSATEEVVLNQRDGAGAVIGSLTFNPTTGVITSLKGMVITAGGQTITAGGQTITAGGQTITAGGQTITAGDLTVSAGDLLMSVGGRARLNLPAAADDAAAAALVPSVPVGGLYHTAGAVKQRLV